MKTMPLARASRPLAEYAAELKDEIVVVTKGKRAVAALVPLKNVDRESLTLSTHPEFLALVRKARAEIAAGRVLSLGQMRARVLSTRRASSTGLRPTAPKRRGG
jgi:antitoxin (DNA-binding transcriptional repressor) of toxin-antitoxin stability system